MMMKKFWMISIASVAALSITGGVMAAQSGQFIGSTKAKEAALSIQEGKVEEIELDNEKGMPVYEVEIKTDGKDDVEVKVDAVTGSIVKVDYDDDVKQKKAANQSSKTNQSTTSTVKAVEKQTKKSNDGRITKEQAIAIALKIVDGKVEEVELDKDDGVLKYEIEIVNSELEADIEIAAYGGKVLSKELDYHDDDDDRYDDDNDDDDDDDDDDRYDD